MLYADSLGFLGLPGGSIQVPENLELDLVHLTSIPPWAKTMTEALIAHDEFVKQVLSQPKLRIVNSKSELDDAIESGKTAVVLGIQHAPQNVDVLALRRVGVRIMSIAYDEENELGSGWKNPKVGLKSAGKAFLEDCEELGMILDLSHSGHQTARDALTYIHERGSRIGVFVSHAGCYSVYPHYRNLPDDVVDKIADRGGIIGIPTLTFILDAKDNTAKPFLRHLKYALSKFGRSAVCIGADAPYVKTDPEKSKEQFEMIKSKLDPDGKMGARWPEYIPEFDGPERMQLIYTVLMKSSLDPQEIELVLGKNLYRFLGEFFNII